MIEAIANQNEGGITNTFKEGIVGIYFDEFRKENQETFNLLKDEKLSDNQKVQILSILQEQFYKKHGYEGTLPEIYLTDEASSFTVDSKNSPDGKERIFISIHHLNDPNFSIASLFGHETGHLNTYDSGEKTANYIQSKIGEDDLSKQFTEREKEEYLKSIGSYYFPALTKEEQFALASGVPMEDRENFAIGISEAFSGGFIGSISIGGSQFIIVNEDFKNYEYARTRDFEIGFGSPNIGMGGSIVILPNVYNSSDLEKGKNYILGASGNIIGGDLIFDENFNVVGFKFSASLSKNLPKDIFTNLGKGEGHARIATSSLVNSKILISEEKLKNNLKKADEFFKRTGGKIENIAEFIKIVNDIKNDIERLDKEYGDRRYK